MSDKKSKIQLCLSLALFFLVSGTSFSQSLMHCSNNNFSFRHMHDYLFIDADRDGYGSTQRSWSLQCTYRVPSGFSINNTDCDDSNAAITPFTVWYRDADGDGHGRSDVTTTGCTQPSGYVSNYNDCNDWDGSVVFNSVWYRDADGDGYGTSSSTTSACNQPSGYVSNASDYNDGTSAITNVAPRYFYRDADGDGHGNPSVSVYYSYQPSGYVTNNSDCNDGDSSIHPSTPWFRDNDGDGYGSGGAPVFSCTQPSGYSRNSGDCNDYDGSISPATVWYRDADGDGYGTSSTTTASCYQPSGYVRNANDYNDGTANITNIAPQTFYRDADGDSFGSATVTVYYSVRPAGYVTNSSDCNDADSSINPNTVWYRDADSDGFGSKTLTTNQCTQPSGYIRTTGDFDDSTVNINNIAPRTFYRDADGDGHGNPSVSVYYSVQPTGYVTNNTDCNDGDANINPNNPWFRDNDGDGYGLSGAPIYSCTQPSGYARLSGDCNDYDSSISPATLWYRDADGDSFGNSNISSTSCYQPSGYVRNASDYDDSTVNITNIAPKYFYRDLDGDWFGNPDQSVFYSVKPSGYVTNSLDCDDDDDTINPNTPWFRDTDNDGYGLDEEIVFSCTQPVGYARNSGDCNDNNAVLNPATIWYKDGDRDGFGTSAIALTSCTPLTDYVLNSADYDDSTEHITNIAPQSFYVDADSDGFGNPAVSVYYSAKPAGYVTNNSDYDDTTVNITNIAPQHFYADNDGDGFGNPSASLYYSVKPAGYVSNNSDCDDVKNTINPNTNWYADVDGDGLGDAASVVTQCAAPAGRYVLNNSDNCPLAPGSSNDCAGLANPAQDKNYIITRMYKQASTSSIDSPTPAQVKVAITYFDGLGRPIQQIVNQQSNTGKDIVTHLEYDNLGRQTKDFLPYVGTNRNMAFESSAKNNTLAFYNTLQYDNTANPFTEKVLESSPLSRVLKQAAPGSDWAMGQGHEIKLDYQTNEANEVKRYTATATWSVGSGLYTTALGNMAGTTFYGANQLYKNVTFDENTTATPSETSGSTVEFKNKEGQVVLKRSYDAGVKHDTYYVYDVYGNLTYVIPPKADMALTQAILDELCYQYQYDNRNRLVAKKLPAKQWEFIVYDKLDRVVATGPAFSPFSDVIASGWLITKYDAFNRVVYTGWLNSSATAATRKTMQDARNSASNLNENKQTSGSIDGINVNYSNGVVPTSFKLLTVNYYDDYAIPTVTIATSVEGQTVATAVKGLATGSWTRVATKTTETKGETSYILYDSRYRPIRSYTTNYLGGYTCTDSKLDSFSGQLQYTLQKHKRTAANTELTVKEAFTYSAQDRLIAHTHQINGGAVQLMAENTYDELGQLMSKKVGNSSAAPLQKVDYAYNIRGWMKSINNPAALQQGSDPADLFGFKINYNTIEGSATAANKLYNGNIAEAFWSTATDGGFVRNYGYKYDQLNRLKDATYQKSNVVTNMYNENLTYDKNGNIMTLKRNGDRDVQTGTIGIDNLSYGYATNSNKLMSVVDNTNNTSGFNDFNKSGNDYAYDVNGNMTLDKNKKITAITYNHLNLPTKIVFATGNIVYIYNAAGQKVQKVVTTTTPASVVTTDYLGGYQYKNTVMQFFPTVEGYVKNTANVFSYVYNYTDHLGNTRLSYTKNSSTNDLTILEESNYYPFGLKHNGYNPISPVPENRRLFNGKELQEELGLNMYDYGSRMYDSARAGWSNVDPLAEKFPDQSPYSFVFNNPMRFVDPDGRAPVDWFKNAAGRVVWFDNTSKGFTDTNGGKWTNIGSNLNEVKQSLNIPTGVETTKWNTVSGFLMDGNDGAGKQFSAVAPVVFNNTAQVDYGLNIKNTEGPFGGLISGKSEITGVSVNATVTSSTYAPGTMIDGVSGNFGVKEWTPSGFNFTSKSSPFQDHSGQMLSNAPFHATSDATMNLSLSTYKNLTNTSSGVSTGLNLKFNTYTSTTNQQTGDGEIFKTGN